MEALRRRGFVQDDTLTFITLPGQVRLVGEIACLGNIVIVVKKYLVCDGHEEHDDNEVQTVTYSYTALVRGHNTFLRCDNAHPHEGHADEHHKHRCDWMAQGEEVELQGSPEWLGRDRWPSLAAFINEVHDWYDEHREELPDPDAVPQLGLRGSPTDGTL